MSRQISRRAVSRRIMLALGALPLAALGGCGVFDNMFADNKPHLPGKRVSVPSTGQAALTADPALAGTVDVPMLSINANWPQPGGTPSHAMGRLASAGLRRRWQADIGAGGGYRRKITAQPLVADGRAFAMDSDGVVYAIDLKNGRRLWTRDTQAKKDRSGNVGGGIAVADGALYASTGRAELLRLDAGTGKVVWRVSLGAPARSAPTVADDRAYVATLDDRLIAFAIKDGAQLWSYQAQTAATTVLGSPAPAYAEGVVVAGFGSGDLVALRADSGTVAWADSLASALGRDSLVDLSAIRGMPVIADRRVYAVGLGGLMVAIDLRSGRRLWERDIASGDTPWLAGNTIYLISTDQDLAALSTENGRIRWVSSLPRYESPKREKGAIFWRGPVLAGDYLLVAGSTEQMLAADPHDGKVARSIDLSDAASLPPIVAGGVTYVVTDDGYLTAYS